MPTVRSTSEEGPQSDSLATALVDGGIPAVLGWDASVHDQSAIDFAKDLYGALAKPQRSLEEACAEARRALLNAAPKTPAPDHADPAKREGALDLSVIAGADWHMARLWLGPQGGGPLVRGQERRRLVATDTVYGVFDRRKQTVTIAAAHMFVGRRRDLQTCLAALRLYTGARRNAGLLIQGMGRSGKSSLAARVLHRRPDLTLVFVEGRFDAATIAADIVDRLPDTRDILWPDDPALLEAACAETRLYERLTQVLTGPCGQTATGRPIALPRRVASGLRRGPALRLPALLCRRWLRLVLAGAHG